MIALKDLAITEEDYRAIPETPIDLGIPVPHKKAKDLVFISRIPDAHIEIITKLDGGLGSLYRLFHLIHSQSFMTKTMWFTLPKDRINKCRLDRSAISRGLTTLEKAGFILVQREPGKAARIALPVGSKSVED
jgi:hypothetical protein